MTQRQQLRVPVFSPALALKSTTRNMIPTCVFVFYCQAVLFKDYIVQESMSASMLRRIRAACLSRTTLALNLFEHVVNSDSSECLATPRLDAALMEFQYDVVMP